MLRSLVIVTGKLTYAELQTDGKVGEYEARHWMRALQYETHTLCFNWQK